MNVLFLALMNVRKRRFAFRLTSLSIMIGLASVILISSVGQSGKEQILSVVRGIGMKGVMFTHTTSLLDGRGFDAAFCRMVEKESGGHVSAMPFTVQYTDVTLAGHTSRALVWGMGEKADKYIDFKLLYGRMPSEAELTEGLPVAVIDGAIAEKIWGRTNAVGQQLTVEKKAGSAAFTVVGVIASNIGTLNAFYADIPDFVYLPYAALEQKAASETGRMVVISDSLSPDEIKTIVKSVIYKTYGSSFKLDVTNFEEGQAGVNQVADLLTLVLSFAASVSLAVAGIGIMSTMLQSVSERKREIGILKALGATRWQIALTFLAEALLVSLYGLVLGIGTGFFLLWICSRSTVLTFSVNRNIFILAILFTGASGLIFGALPALKAAGSDPIDALKND